MTYDKEREQDERRGSRALHSGRDTRQAEGNDRHGGIRPGDRRSHGKGRIPHNPRQAAGRSPHPRLPDPGRRQEVAETPSGVEVAIRSNVDYALHITSKGEGRKLALPALVATAAPIKENMR